MSSGETVLLNQTLGGEIIVIDCVESLQPLKISYLKGSVMPVPAGASAKAFLAFHPSIGLDSFMAEAPLKKYVPKTVIDRKILTRKIMEARHQGYALNDEEIDTGVRAVAAPIIIEGKASYCVSLIGPVVRMPKAQVPEIGQLVKQCAQAIQFAWAQVRI
ncbi:IclR family transcriptional regulator [Pseudomonas yamanorum]|uniref:IclR family transcriptional regulator n=1 Tax=Pseudomonas yamanorum TaxID=515393 RepID=UPI003D35E425